MSARRLRLYLTDSEYRNLEAKFEKDIFALGPHVDHGRALGETIEQFVERMLNGLMVVLRRHRSFLKGIRLPRPRGRPRRAVEPPPAKRSGRPKIFTAEMEAEFIERIDRRVARLEKAGKPATESDALRWSIISHFRKIYREQGLTDAEAKPLAETKAKGPIFKRAREHLARLRSRSRNQPH